ncbi:PREDICTED: uncharacterized protein LOC105557093 [Vollenhovia emeryi]|uniref:uncharacterized protein LOC105557093 n=1 Tax=Vollenhovia emeryi TaxID=411798 RepID=UPI0005F4DC8D|nr:PREDICTED: uncharacterized protein LOC105557093 [Vollenhovia emeryi]
MPAGESVPTKNALCKSAHSKVEEAQKNALWRARNRGGRRIGRTPGSERASERWRQDWKNVLWRARVRGGRWIRRTPGSERASERWRQEWKNALWRARNQGGRRIRRTPGSERASERWRCHSFRRRGGGVRISLPSNRVFRVQQLIITSTGRILIIG